MAERTTLGVGGVDEEPTIHTATTSESGFDGATEDAVAPAISYGEHAGGLVPTGGERGSSTNTNANGNSDSDRNMPVTEASLGRETEGLVLFDLTTKKGARVAFSPHCMKTILDLKLLGIGYDRQRLTFTEIRNLLAPRVADNVTVPTLELANGSHLTDSWRIAEYLYEKHSKGHLLFPTSSSKPFAKMVEGLGKFFLAPELRPLTRVQIYNNLDEESRQYFENVKIGKAKMDKFRTITNEEKENYVEACAVALEPIQAALVVAREQSKTRQVWLEAGPLPTHADFAVYGWQVHSRVAGPAIARAIWGRHAAVAKWVHDMDLFASPDITGDFL